MITKEAARQIVIAHIALVHAKAAEKGIPVQRNQVHPIRKDLNWISYATHLSDNETEETKALLSYRYAYRACIEALAKLDNY